MSIPPPRPTRAGAAHKRFAEEEEPTRVVMDLAERGPDSRRWWRRRESNPRKISTRTSRGA